MLPLVIQIERTEERKADTCAFAHSPVRIGRNSLSDLQLDESFVSQFHAVIRFDEEHTTFLDLGSTNPAVIDGQQVTRNTEVPVTEQTDIRIGSLRLHLLRVEAPPELFGARRKSSFDSGTAAASGGSPSTILFKPAQLLNMPTAAPSQPAQVAVNGQSRPPMADSGEQPRAPSERAVSGVARRSHAPAAGLAGHYEAYRQSRALFFSELQAILAREPLDSRDAVRARILRDFPDLASEPGGGASLSSPSPNSPDLADWVRRLTLGLYPTPGVELNLAQVMERVGQILEVFSEAFVTMRLAHEQFCEEMSLEGHPDDSLLHSTKNPHALLTYLLNPDLGGMSKITELSRALADFSVHQVALVSAVVEGVRDVIAELSPAALTKQDERPGSSFIGKLLGNDQRQLWTRYIGTYDELVEGDGFTRKLFGRAFARKYYAVTGGRASAVPSGEWRAS